MTLFSHTCRDKKCSIFKTINVFIYFGFRTTKLPSCEKIRYTWEPVSADEEQTPLSGGGLLWCAKLHRSSFNLTLWGWAKIGFQALEGDLRIGLASKLKSILDLFIHFGKTEDWHKPSPWAVWPKYKYSSRDFEKNEMCILIFEIINNNYLIINNPEFEDLIREMLMEL